MGNAEMEGKTRERADTMGKGRAKTENRARNGEYEKRSAYIAYLRNVFEITVFMFGWDVCWKCKEEMNGRISESLNESMNYYINE